MRKLRTWRLATTVVAAASLLLAVPVASSAQVPGLPGNGDDDAADEAEATSPAELGAGAFIGCAGATGLQVRIGLPAELEGLNALFEPLGLSSPMGGFGEHCETDFTDSGFGIYLDLSRTQAELHRAALGDEPTALAEALATNLVLENAPCTGLGSASLPDEETPVLTVELLDVNCEESGQRALAEAKVAGVYLNLGTLVQLIGADALTEAVEQLLGALNENLLAPLDDVVCQVTDEGVDTVLDAILGGTLSLCDEISLQLQNITDARVPLIDLDVLDTTSDVSMDGDRVTATATAELAGLELAGLVCVEGSQVGSPLMYTSTVSSGGGQAATASASSTDVTARMCGNPSLLQIVGADGLLNSVRIGDNTLDEILGENLQAVEDGIEQLLVALGISVAPVKDADIESVDGNRALAATPPFTIASVAPFAALPGFNETPLAAISVSVSGLETFAFADSRDIELPRQPPVEPPPIQLPRTGTPAAAGLIGLGAMAAAVALRRRNDG